MLGWESGRSFSLKYLNLHLILFSFLGGEGWEKDEGGFGCGNVDALMRDDVDAPYAG